MLEGIWEGTTPGRFGDLGIIKQADGKQITFPMHTVLADRFKRIRDGAEVQIHYLGKEVNKKGTEFKNFEIFVGDPATDIIPETAEEGDKEVPF